MDNFQKEFVMNMFLEDDSCTTNKLTVAMSSIVKENSETLSKFNDIMMEEYKQISFTDLGSPHTNRLVTRRNKGFYEQTVRYLSEENFIAQFKISRNSVQALITFLRNYVTPGSISLDKKVHVFLWLLVTDCSYSDCGKLFGLHKSSVSYIFHEIATHLNDQRDQFISWPSTEEQHITRIKVNSRFKFPNCVGFIDACHFKVGTRRFKRDKSDTVLLQAVCDETLMFIDFHVGDIGQTKKIKVYKESKLASDLKNCVEFENHILGDSNYKLRNNLITPFTSDELLTSEDMKFNEIHWKTRSYIGHAFELMKERFTKLSHIDIVKPESIKLLLSVACILHNFILMHEGSSVIKEELVTCDDGVTINTNIVQNAEEKRQFLCNYINFIDMEDIET